MDVDAARSAKTNPCRELIVGSRVMTVFTVLIVLPLGAVPFVLALPAGLEIAVVAVVVQSLVELFGMIADLRLAPRLVRSHPAP